MNIIAEIIEDENGTRDARITLDAVEVGLSVAFRADARSCRVIAARLTEKAEELERLVVLPKVPRVCRGCAGALREFSMVPVWHNDQWVHKGLHRLGAIYRCTNPPVERGNTSNA